MANSINLDVSFSTVDGDKKEIKADAYKIWAAVSSNDPDGLTIQNVLKGDEVIIYDAIGTAYFSSSKVNLIKGVIGVANAVAGDVLMFATEGAAAPFVKGWNESLSALGSAFSAPDDKGSKARDSYGKDSNSGDFAKGEGGVIVCMPDSSGALYASDDNRLKDGAKANGRKPEYFSDNVKNSNAFFPFNGSGGQMSAIAGKSGNVHILAFDGQGNGFTDNQGKYTLGIIVVRADQVFAKDSIMGKLLGAEPTNMTGE